ncbi:type IV secretion system DNA-binding domain-containing protein [Candidatus Uhrbacteria bacterium]|nr:type IV secretion system DNA-binding domain-containing protein [Candidatus Uhrbacteria bacterium]
MGYEHDHENEITYFARTNYRNALVKFGIRTDDRRRHVYVIGKTGMGKTNLLENLIYSDIVAGHGCCYVDPHGDTAEKLIDFIPSWRMNDVVYVNPADLDFPIGFNILEAVSERHKHLIASGMMGVFKKIWEDQWSARMEYILNNTILALLDNPGSTLLGINRMFSDAEFRKKTVSNVKDPVVKTFWLQEYASYSEKYATEAVAAIQNKIGQFLSASVIRNMVAQVKSTINIRALMDEGKIIIINLSKGRIGEDNMRLLGGMLITKMQLSAMERVDIPEKDRKDFYLYVDEFQNFAVESFASILSEARKYRLCLTMAHQYIMQLSDEVREAVFGNVGTMVTFRVGGPDATYMEKEFTPRFLIEDIINIPKYNVYLKLLINGVTSQPFSALMLPPIQDRTGSSEKVIRVSRERYARPRQEIEEKILRWSGMDDVDVDKMLADAQEKKKSMKASRKPKFEYDCTRCGTHLTLPVELDRSRPIYCESCIEIIRAERKGGGGAKGAGSTGGAGAAIGSRTPPPASVAQPARSTLPPSLPALSRPPPAKPDTASPDSPPPLPVAVSLDVLKPKPMPSSPPPASTHRPPGPPPAPPTKPSPTSPLFGNGQIKPGHPAAVVTPAPAASSPVSAPPSSRPPESRGAEKGRRSRNRRTPDVRARPTSSSSAPLSPKSPVPLPPFLPALSRPSPAKPDPALPDSPPPVPPLPPANGSVKPGQSVTFD